MQLIRADVRNFRSLENVTLDIDRSTTLIVGRNNSGKTSFVNLFERFFGEDSPKFILDDLSTARIADIEQAISLQSQAQELHSEGESEKAGLLTDRAIALLPAIRLLLTVSYEEDEDLTPIVELILDLDEDCHEVQLEARASARSPLEFLKQAAQAARSDTFQVNKYLPKAFAKHFATDFRAIGTGSASAERVEVPRATARRVFSTMFVYAQTKFDDISADRTRNLSKTFEAFYKANSEDEHVNVSTIENVLETASTALDKSFEGLFKDILEEIGFFGTDIIGPIQRPQIVSEFDPVGIMRGNTRIKYLTGEGDYPLPEGHNGLGYSKLIFLVLQVVSFFEAYQRATPRPALQMLFIEEPEAHLHPQMQETFIRNIQAFIERKRGWRVQVVITTHSSHIVASSGFNTVRYFDRSGPRLTVKNLSEFAQKTHPAPAGAETLRFLTQYMHLHRCDMFFADKVILIEGTSERLLMPQMIRSCAEPLAHQYVSVIEVGDGYAVRFKDLLAFLGVRTLIITDIDSVDPADQRSTCRTSAQGAVTCNKTLKDWLPGTESISSLLTVTDEEKSTDRIRVAYQVPEETSVACGRSFEEAFILANSAVLSKVTGKFSTHSSFTNKLRAPLTAEEIAAGAWDIARSLRKKKTDFAYDIMLLDDAWIVPRYIREGLQWLALP